MAATPVRRILIVGGGTAGWMTAAALAQALGPSPVRINLVESEAIGTVGVGESTIPHIRAFNARLGLDEAAFMAETMATYKLAIEFVDWGRLGARYVHPFGAFGEPLDEIEFHQLWLAAGGAAGAGALDDYSLAAALLRQARFRHPAADPAALEGSYAYAFQFDAGLYARCLRRYAEARGVRRTEGKVAEVARDPDSGRLLSVTLDGGAVLAAV